MPQAPRTSKDEILGRPEPEQRSSSETFASHAAAHSRLAILLLVLLAAGAIHPSAWTMASSDDSDASDGKPSEQATLKSAAASAPDIPFARFDAEAERMLLELANRSRAQAGLPSLTIDDGLSHAARLHAEAMVAAQRLSHQFESEASLPQRLADATRIQLDQEGENVAFDFNAEDGHEHLMQSPPHRANLLNAAYNVIGIGVARGPDGIYIVQDFGHALPNCSLAEVKEKVAATFIQSRHQARQPGFTRRDLANADDAACSMAHEDKLDTSPIHDLARRYTVLSYTTLHPETLPSEAAHVLTNHSLHTFSVGVCYARTETYPTGVYWIVLSLE